jgi:hypothetical protein
MLYAHEKNKFADKESIEKTHKYYTRQKKKQEIN